MVLIVGLLGPAAASSAEPRRAVVEQPQGPYVVSGTLEMLDMDAYKGRLRSDLGRPIFFDFIDPTPFRKLTIGERITVQLDEAGRAVKVIEHPPPDLPGSQPPS